eukprot:337674-Pyramimonas_sp.AAC.1
MFCCRIVHVYAQSMCNMWISLPSRIKESDEGCTSQVFVKTVTGNTIAVDANCTDTIKHVKPQISEKEGAPHDMQFLNRAGRQLKNVYTLSKYG